MATATVTDIGTLIEQTPGICGGRPCIAGTGVSVLGIAGRYKAGWSPEEISRRNGYITLAQVYAALAYYHANRAEMDAEMAAEEVLYDRLAAEQREARAKARQ